MWCVLIFLCWKLCFLQWNIINPLKFFQVNQFHSLFLWLGLFFYLKGPKGNFFDYYSEKIKFYVKFWWNIKGKIFFPKCAIFRPSDFWLQNQFFYGIFLMIIPKNINFLLNFNEKLKEKYFFRDKSIFKQGKKLTPYPLYTFHTLQSMHFRLQDH